jgi:hypothetical protein
LGIFRFFLLFCGFGLVLGLFSGCAMVAAYPVTAVSVGSTATTGKSLTDHAASESTGHDCSVMRVFDGQPACEKRLKPSEVPVQDYSRKKKLVPVDK